MISNIRHIHMVGICGTAMGAVAVLLKQRGYCVTGSDAAAYPPMSDVLAQNGIDVTEGFRGENLEPAPDLVVIGNAMSRGNEEVESVLERRLPYTSLAETLKEFFIRGKTSIVVTGTHGKTTTSSLLAWVLDCAGRDPGFMIGGVPENFGIGARLGGGELWVSEGDEYDTAFFDKRSKFFHYLPEYVILNNIEFDHADIFDSIEDIKLSFRRLVNLIPRNGVIVANAMDERVMRVSSGALCPRVTYAVSDGCDADWRATDIRHDPSGTRFMLTGPSGSAECFLPLFGQYNVANAVAVAALCSQLGVELDAVVQGCATFRGVKRRLQRLSAPDGVVVYDDFAHHPTAIDGALRGVRAAHPESRIWAIFEPRSNTTVRNVFQRELAEALSNADEVVVGELHRRDQVPEAVRLDVDRLIADVQAAGTHIVCLSQTDDIISHVAGRVQSGDTIVIMSNGAFGSMSRRLPEALRHAPGLADTGSI